MTSAEKPDDTPPDNLPLLTQIACEDALDDLPVLTEIVDGSAGPEAPPREMAAPDEEAIQRLLRHLEAHLESAFAHKLDTRLEQLQRQAVGQVIDELKAELPELLRNALNERAGL